jgi:hypothetical protein
LENTDKITVHIYIQPDISNMKREVKECTGGVQFVAVKYSVATEDTVVTIN